MSLTNDQQQQLEDAARNAAADFKDATAETKAAYLQALAGELGMGKALDVAPKTQAGLLDAIHEHVGNKSLLQRATFVRGAIAILDMDARMIVNGERRRSSFTVAPTTPVPTR